MENPRETLRSFQKPTQPLIRLLEQKKRKAVWFYPVYLRLLRITTAVAATTIMTAKPTARQVVDGDALVSGTTTRKK
jgi:hypothetical protein